MHFKSFVVVCALAAGLGACNSRLASIPDPSVSTTDAKYMAMVPTVDLPADFRRQEVNDPTGEAPGTVLIDSRAHFLYFVLPNHRAIRYGVATGAEAQGWTGIAYVGRKAEWPRWIPPSDMLARWPHLKPTVDAGGLPGGPDNPLGARAMYLYQGNKDTLYRIHGTNEPEKIGQDVSSGCIRMTNIDAIDLFNRIKVGAKVIVK